MSIQSGEIGWATRLAERTGAGVWTDYIFGGGKRVAKAPAEAITTNTEYYHSDHLGTASWMTNASGAQIYSATYLPYGYEFNGSGSTANHYKFTGKERDSESNLDYFGARYYATTQGRFLSVDPSNKSIEKENPQSWNRFNYTLNNPLAYVDHNGKWPTKVHNEIIRRAFPGLTEAQRGAIMSGSAKVDCGTCHGEKKAFQHSLKGSKQKEEEAISKTASFVASERAKAASLGTTQSGLEAFGRESHPITDATSPSHQGTQTWNNPVIAILKIAMGDPSGIVEAAAVVSHIQGEANPTEAQIEDAVSEIRNAYGATFGAQALAEAVDANNPSAVADRKEQQQKADTAKATRGTKAVRR